MKAYSATMVIGIIIAVIIGVFILYMAWSKGFLPFSKATSEAQCKAYLSEDCQRSSELGWNPNVFTNVKGCRFYVSNKDAFDCCLDKNKCLSIDKYKSSTNARNNACRDMCSEFLNITSS